MEDFEQIYSSYYDTVYHYLLSLCHDAEWAQEITQEAFFKALQHIDSFRGDCKLDVWLCQIVKNAFYTAAKRRQNRDFLSAAPSPPDKTVEEGLLDQETAFAIHKLLHALDEPYKEVFWMRTFGELSFKKIGALFGKTESWARVTYYRAKIKIKEGLQ